MNKWTKLLAVPMTLALFAGCADQGTEEPAEEETTEVESETEETEVSGEETDADSEATADEDEITPEEAFEEEDLDATGEAEKGTTIEDVDMTADDWVEQAAEATDAVEGDEYVELDRGVLTVDQIDEFLKSMPVELTYADDNNQFLYYNHMLEPDEMLGARDPVQAGDPLTDVHPESSYENVSWVVNQLRTGETDHVRMAVPAGDEDQFVVHDYYGIYDDDGNYMGINEIIHDIMPEVEFYLEETGQELVGGDEEADADSAATPDEEDEESAEDSEEESEETDADSGATEDE